MPSPDIPVECLDWLVEQDLAGTGQVHPLPALSTSEDPTVSAWVEANRGMHDPQYELEMRFVLARIGPWECAIAPRNRYSMYAHPVNVTFAQALMHMQYRSDVRLGRRPSWESLNRDQMYDLWEESAANSMPPGTLGLRSPNSAQAGLRLPVVPSEAQLNRLEHGRQILHFTLHLSTPVAVVMREVARMATMYGSPDEGPVPVDVWESAHLVSLPAGTLCQVPSYPQWEREMRAIGRCLGTADMYYVPMTRGDGRYYIISSAGLKVNVWRRAMDMMGLPGSLPRDTSVLGPVRAQVENWQPREEPLEMDDGAHPDQGVQESAPRPLMVSAWALRGPNSDSASTAGMEIETEVEPDMSGLEDF